MEHQHVTKTHTEVESKNEITHKYLSGSCGTTENQFIAVLRIENACSVTESTINNIVILEPSIANFESPNTGCVNSPISFTNTSIIGDNPDCTEAANFKWNFGDGTVINDNNTNLITNQTHTYKEAKTYTATLYVTTNCGIDSISKKICIEPKMIPKFTVSNEDGCIPMNVITNNTTDESDLCMKCYQYEWSVNYSSDNCGDSSRLGLYKWDK